MSFTSKIQGSLSTSTAEAVNQCLKEEALAIKVMLILMGFPQDATIIEEKRLTSVMDRGITLTAYASPEVD